MTWKSAPRSEQHSFSPWEFKLTYAGRELRTLGQRILASPPHSQKRLPQANVRSRSRQKYFGADDSTLRKLAAKIVSGGTGVWGHKPLPLPGQLEQE